MFLNHAVYFKVDGHAIFEFWKTLNQNNIQIAIVCLPKPTCLQVNQRDKN